MDTPTGQEVCRLPPSDPRGGLLGFWALIATQFQGAFSDNALKWLVSFLVLESSISREQRDFLFVLVVPLVFAVPFLIFSVPGGYFADRFSKRSVTVRTKVLELDDVRSNVRTVVESPGSGGSGIVFRVPARRDLRPVEIWVAA